MFTELSRNKLGLVMGSTKKLNLIQKENHPPLQNDKNSSLGRLNNLTRNLIRLRVQKLMIKLKEDQIREDIVERVTKSEKNVDIQKK